MNFKTWIGACRFTVIILNRWLWFILYVDVNKEKQWEFRLNKIGIKSAVTLLLVCWQLIYELMTSNHMKIYSSFIFANFSLLVFYLYKIPLLFRRVKKFKCQMEISVFEDTFLQACTFMRQTGKLHSINKKNEMRYTQFLCSKV